MAKPLERAIAQPPLPVIVATPDLMFHHFQRAPVIDNAGAYRYAYTSFGAAPQSLVGAATGMKRQGLRAITIPLVSVPTFTRQGSGFTPGTMTITPVTDENGAVNVGGL